MRRSAQSSCTQGLSHVFVAGMDFVFLYLTLCLLFLVVLITPSNLWFRQCFEGRSERYPRRNVGKETKKE